jgi:hypothetical protein
MLWVALVSSAGKATSSGRPAPLPAQASGLDHNTSTGAAPAQNWSSFRYYFAPGSALHPRDDDTTWEYGGSGCVYSSAGGEMFTMHLNLPEGSRIDYLRIYYYDSSSSNDSRAWISAYDAEGGHTDLASADSAGTSGYGNRLSAYVGHIVSNRDNAYALNWDPKENSASMKLCGLRVAYRVPLVSTFLPLALRSH